jgi:hypothetical protein
MSSLEGDHAAPKTYGNCHARRGFQLGPGRGLCAGFFRPHVCAFFDEEFGIDIDQEKYRTNGNSKGKRLRTFLSVEDGATAARVLVTLWDHRAAILARQGGEDDPNLTDRYFQIVHQLQGDAGKPSIDAIDRFVREPWTSWLPPYSAISARTSHRPLLTGCTHIA